MSNWRKILSWQIPDTRALFTSYVSRKPGSWIEAKAWDFHQFDTMHQQALLSKKLLEMNLARPDTYFPTSADTQEFILHNQYDGFYYYVDTEGHNYARYTFRILNFPK